MAFMAGEALWHSEDSREPLCYRVVVIGLSRAVGAKARAGVVCMLA